MSSNESGSGSESEPEFESIIATRARRSNAGSRLRQLLDLEETNAGLQAATEDDENVNLLFQEDEDDIEFKSSSEEESEADNSDVGSDNDSSNRKNITNRKRKQETSDNEDDELTKAASDEMLSDSEISASDSDEEEGEKELQRQERLKKRRKRNTGLPIAAQTKPKPSSVKHEKTKKSPRKSVTGLTPIAPHERRHSRRTATVKSSIATHEKLEKELEKKQVVVPVARKEYVEKTLEERLEEAKITEKENMLSLTRFYEQEIQKKKKQRDLANSRKFRMVKFLRMWSTGVYITPDDEVAEIEEEKRIKQEEEEKKQRRKLAYLKRKQTRLGITDDSLVLAELERDSKEKETQGNDDVKKELSATGEPAGEAGGDDQIGNEKNSNEDNNQINSEINVQDRITDEKTNNITENELERAKSNNELSGDGDDSNMNTHLEETFIEETPVETKMETSIEATSGSVDGEIVSAAAEPAAVVDGESEAAHSKDLTPKIIHEGPALKVARSYLIFEEFDEKLALDEIKTHLFGRQSLLTGTRRDPNAEPILVIKRDESSNLDLQKIHAARKESLDALLKLPKFGETVVIADDDDDKSNDKDDEEVKIHTPAPIGIHLPDGNKKMCLITGTPAVYYDPSTGIPYSTVDSFKIIKAIIDGEYDWIQQDNGGINSRIPSGVGFYAPKRSERCAKGVPEGF